jgi:hypothetical protein
MSIQVAGPRVVAIGVLPGLRFTNLLVTLVVPLVPLILGFRRFDTKFLIVSPLDVNDLVFLNLGAALWGGNLRFPLAHDQLSLAGGIHLNAINTFRQGTDGHIRRINLDLRFRALENAEIDDPRRHLNLHLGAAQVRDLGFRTLVEAQHIGKIQLNLRARLGSRRHLITGHHGSVDGGRHPLAGVTAHRGNIPIDDTDAPHSGLGFVLSQNAGRCE